MEKGQRVVTNMFLEGLRYKWQAICASELKRHIVPSILAVRSAAGTDETKAVALVKRNEVALGQKQNLLHVSVVTNLLEVGGHHSGAQALSPVRRVDDDTVNTEHFTEGVVASHDVMGDSAGVIRGCSGDHEADKVSDAVEEGDVAEVFGNDGAVLKIET